MMNSVERIQAIFTKDYKEFSRNYALSIMMLFPIVFAFFYRDMPMDIVLKAMFPLSFTFGMFTAFVQACLIAEEKERNTLRSLLLSPASLIDILIGKSLLVTVVSAVSIALSFYTIGYMPPVMMIIGIFISLLFYAALGTICGLFAKSSMEASFTVLPVMILFPFGPYMLLVADKYTFLKAAKWLPSSQLELVAIGEKVGSGMLIITLWTVIAWVCAIVLCKKRMVD